MERSDGYVAKPRGPAQVGELRGAARAALDLAVRARSARSDCLTSLPAIGALFGSLEDIAMGVGLTVNDVADDLERDLRTAGQWAQLQQWIARPAGGARHLAAEEYRGELWDGRLARTLCGLGGWWVGAHGGAATCLECSNERRRRMQEGRL